MSDAAFVGFADAERVPVWTRPTARSFAAQATGQAAGGFARWSDDAPANEPYAAHAAPSMHGAEALIAQGYAEGLEAGRIAAYEEVAGERAALQALARGLQALNPEDGDGLAQVLAASVKRLVTQIVGEVEINAETLVERCQAVAAAVAEETTPSRLRLHPTDVARLDGAGFSIDMVGDPLLAPGTVVLDTGHGWVEDGPHVRLERLRNALDKLGAPK
jgi:flagellar assembly protein FliH